MMPDFESHNRSKQPNSGDSLTGNAGNHNQPVGALDMLKRDRFEMLSAYLDGEVTAEERRQVEAWLATDPVVQRLYDRLLKLRQGVQTMPVPASTQSVEQTIDKVFTRVNRRPKMALMWGGAAVAALVVGAISGVLPGGRSWEPQFAQSSIEKVNPAQSMRGIESASTAVRSDALMIALDQPVVQIPKAPVSAPAESFDSF